MNYNYSDTGLLKEIGTETNTTVYANSGKYNDAGILTQLIAGNTLELTQSIDEAKNQLTAAIECFKNNPESNDLVNFLCNQKQQLTDEIKANKEHLSNMVYTNNYGAKINSSEIRKPHSGIDYMKAYEGSKKNESKKDE